MMELFLILTAMFKLLFNSKHLLSILISFELMNLCLISMSWQNNWTITLWILIMSVAHSIIGFVLLLLMIRHYGNDKNLNLII
nr:NADH dehydrogenase subunit 4L [Pseudocapillaria tomentosa]